MALHTFDFTAKSNKTGVTPERAPLITPRLPQQPDLEEKDELVNSDVNLNQPEDVRSVLVRGFHAMDEGMKRYFEKLQVPTKDATRALTVRVAGGDKTFLIWAQEVRAGRIKLPVLSINRTGWRFNPEKFSPPHIEMARRFANNDGSRMILTYRPWPALLDYTLSFWTERKRDIEYIMHQILIRFNPLGEIRIEDESGLRGNAQIRLGDSSDNSDIDVGAEDLAKVRYDVNVTLEGWLPLPDKILPTALGKVTSLHEFDGTFLESLDASRSIVADNGFFKSPGVSSSK